MNTGFGKKIFIPESGLNWDKDNHSE